MKRNRCMIYHFAIIPSYQKAKTMAEVVKTYGYDGYNMVNVAVRKRGDKRYVICFQTK